MIVDCARSGQNFDGAAAVEELGKRQRGFSPSEASAMIAELESAFADCGKFCEASLIAKDLLEDAGGLRIDARWIIHLFPSVDLLIRLSGGAEGGLELSVPAFCEDPRWWICSAAHAAMLERGAEYTSSSDFPKCMNVGQLVKPSRIFVLRTPADWPAVATAAKLAVSNASTIVKFCATLDARLGADMAAVSKRLHQLNAELRDTYDRVSALHKKTGALWDIVSSADAQT